MTEPPKPAQRVSAIPLPDGYRLPAKPDDPAAQDAHRQATFILGNDLRLFEQAMQLQLRITRDAAHSAFRKYPYAAIMGLWSRTYSALTDACMLTLRGSYASVPPLVRAACEQIAAQHQLHLTDMELFTDWLGEALLPNDEHKAIDVGIGRYFAGETLAADATLRAVYRPASELGRPNFGATLVEAGPESNNRRLALSFGETAFHLGWAELTLGWLLSLGERQLAVAVHAADVFAIHEDTHAAYTDIADAVAAALARPDRCSIDEVPDGDYTRFLVGNMRRAAGGAPKKLLL